MDLSDKAVPPLKKITKLVKYKNFKTELNLIKFQILFHDDGYETLLE